jgi:hypothetical protein
LYEFIIFRKSSKEFNEKKYLLLAEKAFRLISKKRMNGLTPAKIYQLLQKEANVQGFNLYQFVDQFKN